MGRVLAMKYIIAGGTGFIGQALVRHWLQKGYKITVVGRSKNKIQTLFNNQVNGLTWEQLLQQPATSIQEARAIINLAGENIGTKIWSTQRKRILIESRVHPTKTLAKLCAKLGKNSPPLLNASGVGIYGLQDKLTDGAVFTENTPIDDIGQSFLTKIGQKWEEALKPAKDAGVRTVAMRFGVVLSLHGGVLKQLLPLYKLGLGGRLGTGQQPFAWISLIDLCAAIDFIIQHTELVGAVNLVAPHAITQYQLAVALSQALNRPCLFKIPAGLLKFFLGEMADELLLHGQRVVPQKLLAAGFLFQNANLASALTKS
ncbi:MAG: Epimerase family protein [Gammaproteobacteria bacterium]|jgi:uncharacterized protein (TIGR01777 family)|nr:Epimerase family protein [Gammaproteobacteria bacterium]